jgi:hypothetical protein
MSVDQKECRKCGETKDLVDFYKHKGFRDGRHSQCKACVRTNNCKWMKANRRSKGVKPREKKAKNPKAHMGLTKEEYEDLLFFQDGKCAICEKPEAVLARRLALDHNHKTGQIRGLLCSSCNPGLGYFHDDIELLHKAAAYLDRHEQRPAPSINANDVVAMYESGTSERDIAFAFGTAIPFIQHILIQSGIERRRVGTYAE